MDLISQELGKKLSTKQVAEITGLDSKTVIKYYDKLGGIKVGKRYLFFERRLIDAISQPQSEEQGEVSVGSSSQSQQEAEDKVVRFKKRSPRVGEGTKEDCRRDVHGIFG